MRYKWEKKKGEAREGCQTKVKDRQSRCGPGEIPRWQLEGGSRKHAS
jgi:hypothetical protein